MVSYTQILERTTFVASTRAQLSPVLRAFVNIAREVAGHPRLRKT